MIRTTVMSALGLAVFGWPSEVAPQARLEVRDSILLEQPADALLGLPTAVSLDSAGYLVVDAQQPQVFRFDETGRYVRRFGREGEGPGELTETAAAIPYGPDQVLVVSWLPPAAQVFRRSTGEFIARFEIAPPVEDVLLSGDEIWISGSSYSTRTGLRISRLGQNDEARLGPLPAEFREGGSLGGIFPSISFAVWADTVVIGFEPTNTLLLQLRDGTLLDTIEVPVQRRRGVPPDPTARLVEAMQTGPYANVFGVFSTLQAVHRNRDGSITVVHYDHRAERPPVTSEVYVSVISPDRREACVDAQVPVGREANPAIGFKGDELLVLEQVIHGIEAVPVLRSFRIDTSRCSWVSINP